jgi:hypothetical protein
LQVVVVVLLLRRLQCVITLALLEATMMIKEEERDVVRWHVPHLHREAQLQ